MGDLMDWTPVIASDRLPVGKAIRVEVGDLDLFLYADGEVIFALDNRCSHVGGPLHRGRVKGGSQPTVMCPIHGSIFRLTDGRVLRGPASAPQPVFDVRVNGDVVEVRARQQ